MLFNSLEFAVFLPVIFAIYWWMSKSRLELQNLFLLIASYFFYACWDYRFLTLLIFSTVVDFTIGLYLKKYTSNKKRKILLLISVVCNLGVLFVFKYFNFFIENFIAAFTLFGNEINQSYWRVVLPLGISFYTFQTLSYTIDVYKGKIEPSNKIIDFAVFVCFFPQLVAGPIERASNLLPQFSRSRKFNYQKTIDGLRQILWGLFKKMVIADSCADFSNQIFDNYETLNGSALIMGVFFFSFQIYGDFSGYSDIAIGVARILGFDLKQNFSFPYFSRSIAEFWRRWHISLTTWFKDYVYIPLGGSKVNMQKNIRNVLIVFILSGFWHGAKWTFIMWGFVNALYFIPLLLLNKNRGYLNIIANEKKYPSAKEFLQMSTVFVLVAFSWIFFRSENMEQALGYINGIFSKSMFTVPNFEYRKKALLIIILIIGFVIVEWSGRRGRHALELIATRHSKRFRYFMYYLLVFLILWFGGTEQEFIYFQF